MVVYLTVFLTQYMLHPHLCHCLVSQIWRYIGIRMIRYTRLKDIQIVKILAHNHTTHIPLLQCHKKANLYCYGLGEKVHTFNLPLYSKQTLPIPCLPSKCFSEECHICRHTMHDFYSVQSSVK